MSKKIIEELKDRIKIEINNDYSISNLHGVNLNKCLVEPYLCTFIDALDNSQNLDLFVVLKEDPVNDLGYQIVYDPKLNKFGLTAPKKGSDRVFIGYYGTFLETLKGM